MDNVLNELNMDKVITVGYFFNPDNSLNKAVYLVKCNDNFYAFYDIKNAIFSAEYLKDKQSRHEIFEKSEVFTSAVMGFYVLINRMVENESSNF